jgi:hypothetical protein
MKGWKVYPSILHAVYFLKAFVSCIICIIARDVRLLSIKSIVDNANQQ